MFSSLDLLRLFAAFAIIFALIPYLVFGRKLARGFIHAAFFFQVAAMVLGDWRIFLPGTAFALYVLWGAAAFWMVRRRQGVQPARAMTHLIHYLEQRPAILAPRLAALRRVATSPVAAALLVIAAAFALRASWFALHNVRMLRLESYSRALSLHTLMRGDLWDHDASVALLAPLAWLSRSQSRPGPALLRRARSGIDGSRRGFRWLAQIAFGFGRDRFGCLVFHADDDAAPDAIGARRRRVVGRLCDSRRRFGR